MKNIIIEKANHANAETVADLVAELLSDFNRKNGSNFLIDRKYLQGVAEKLLVKDNYAAYIAYESSTPLGLITIAQSSSIYNGGDFGVITELYVDRLSRSKGIGKLLLDAAFTFSRQMGWKKLEVGAPDQNQWPRTIEFYKSNGFKEKGPKLRIDL